MPVDDDIDLSTRRFLSRLDLRPADHHKLFAVWVEELKRLVPN